MPDPKHSPGVVIINRGNPLGRPDLTIGCYLAAFDPDARDGHGTAEWTTDPAGALIFASFRAAFACWQAQSAARPIRPDGKPNGH